jgi:hypothetical protein
MLLRRRDVDLERFASAARVLLIPSSWAVLKVPKSGSAAIVGHVLAVLVLYPLGQLVRVMRVGQPSVHV